MAIMVHEKFNFNRFDVNLDLWHPGLCAPLPPQACRTTEKAGPDRVKYVSVTLFSNILIPGKRITHYIFVLS